MKILAISGSARRLSTNTALLRALQAVAPESIVIDVFDGIGNLPVFSPDLDADPPESVRRFKQALLASDGVLIASPEYVRSIPGGLKNAIDWLVSGDQVVGKPMALVHASHRGDDMLKNLRTVLATVSANFNEGLLLRVPVMKETPDAILALLRTSPQRELAERFLLDFAAFCRNGGGDSPSFMVS
jgi:NAD(P)H-dependent FMN reductase